MLAYQVPNVFQAMNLPDGIESASIALGFVVRIVLYKQNSRPDLQLYTPSPNLALEPVTTPLSSYKAGCTLTSGGKASSTDDLMSQEDLKTKL
jgi:hypothetical protein